MLIMVTSGVRVRVRVGVRFRITSDGFLEQSCNGAVVLVLRDAVCVCVCCSCLSEQRGDRFRHIKDSSKGAK